MDQENSKMPPIEGPERQGCDEADGVNCMAEGMCIGMLFGLLLSKDTAMGMCFGLTIGAAIGSMIKTKPKE